MYDLGGADARSTEVSVGCFASDASVLLTNGEQKKIDYLKTGDEILTVNQLKVVPSEMVIMLDKETSKQGIYSILIFLFSFLINLF